MRVRIVLSQTIRHIVGKWRRRSLDDFVKIGTLSRLTNTGFPATMPPTALAITITAETRTVATAHGAIRQIPWFATTTAAYPNVTHKMRVADVG